VARESIIKKPIRSVTVVKIGPEAIAGSNPTLLARSGRQDPRQTAKMVFSHKLTATIPPRKKDLFQR
jgi:hypothetical protein